MNKAQGMGLKWIIYIENAHLSNDKPITVVDPELNWNR
jgi:hypothetical protein